jgi:hypothetical protein
MVGKGFAKGFGERQGRGSLASHLRFACEIGAVLGVFSHDRTVPRTRRASAANVSSSPTNPVMLAKV